LPQHTFISIYLLCIIMGANKEFLNHDLFQDNDIDINLELEFILQIFIFDKDGIEFFIYLDIPRQKNELTIVRRIQV
jgi:hypothetical protein